MKHYLIEATFSGQVVNYPLKDGNAPLCFLLNKKIAEIFPIDELFLDAINHALESKAYQLIWRNRPDNAYCFIKTQDNELKLEVEVKHYNGRINLIIKNTDESITDFLALNYAGEDISLRYYQSNNQEYLDKKLLEKMLLPNETVNAKKLKI